MATYRGRIDGVWSNDDGIGCLPADCRPAMHAARLLYAEIGRTVESNGYDSVTRRAVVPTARKLALQVDRSEKPGHGGRALPEVGH